MDCIAARRKTFVARDHLVYSSLARRSEALAQSWKGVLDLERSRINDAVESWRASFLATSGMLKKLKEESQRERLRRTQWFDQEVRKKNYLATKGRRRRHLVRLKRDRLNGMKLGLDVKAVYKRHEHISIYLSLRKNKFTAVSGS